ncbi:MAG: sodium:solute symporter family protein [Saprospiraceae bacterium]
MQLSLADWIIIGIILLAVLSIGIWSSRTSGKSAEEYFLSGRNMPWWLLGISMVATTFSADTPNFVADVVRQNGVAGNWVWWAFLLTGMLTVFIYAKLWRKSGINTDLEFYELRYSGGAARFLRGFRAVYLGIIFNVFVMAAVMLAAIKIGGVILGWPPLQTIGVASGITLIFSLLGGFRGVVFTDALLFVISMAGALIAAYFAVSHPDIGSLTNLFAHEAVQDKMAIIPDLSNKTLLIELCVIPLAVQWWSSWYPGSEPGGGGYIAQRMLAAKDEKHAIGATFLFNIAHYGLRPWPWIIVALCSIVIFPDLDSLRTAFPNIEEGKIGHDLAYPAMLSFIPHGLFGLVIASLLSAFMSTISTHLNWGSSYVVFDMYKRFISPKASEKELVTVGRLSVALLLILSTIFALFLTNAKQIFDIIIYFGAGTGLLFILRWFWWRINAWSEISAMFVSGIIAIIANKTAFFDFSGVWKLPLCILITTIIWILVTYLTRPTDSDKLQSFVKKCNPGGPGWKNYTTDTEAEWVVPNGIKFMIISCIFVYAGLFATGYYLYSDYKYFGIMITICLLSGGYLYSQRNNLKFLTS